MKTKQFFLILCTAFAVVIAGCNKDDNPEPKDDDTNIIDDDDDNGQIDDDGKRIYPANAIVWSKDTTITLTDHFVVPIDKALFIEEGATIIMNNPTKIPEIVVLGNLYSYGTAAKPVTFTVPQQYRSYAQRFDRHWGGIICGYDSEEVLLLHTIIEYAGGQTTEESASFQYQLFKTKTGEGVPGFHFCNPDGKFVISNCIFRNNAEDHIYITGGESIIMHTLFYSSGFDGGEAINYKSDCLADLAYNVIYDANTNAFKLSNSGLLNFQSHIYVYNNTIVNTGWRRPKIKGGSIWLETNILAEVFNNIIYDCRHAVKDDVKDPRDLNSVHGPNFLFASTEDGIAQLAENETTGILRHANDKASTTAGTNNPNFVNFTQSTVDIMVGITDSGNTPDEYNENWDFHLQSGSPALAGGTTSITPHFNTSGLVIDGKTYKSPAPSSFFGAFGSK